MSSFSTALFATIFFVAYMLVAFVWPSVRTARATGINPVVLGRSGDAYDYIGRCFKAVLGLVPMVILASWFQGPYSYLGALPYLSSPAIQYTGVTLCLISLLWTMIAQAQMGRSWRIGIDRERQTELVQSGLFRVSRNPIFLGMIATLVGFFLLLPNAVSLVVLVSGYLLIQIQIRLEEAHLATMHGEAYSTYREKTRRLL